MNARVRLSLLALLLVAAGVPAAETESVPGLVDVRFRHIGVEHGLSQVSARVMAQDGEGMLWIGTQDGLDRFDGEDVLVFRRDPSDASSLSDNHVSALLVDRDGRLWVGTQNGGVGRLEPDAGRFQNFFATPGQPGALASLPVHALAQDTQGRIWVASGRGHLQRLQDQSQRFEDVVIPADVRVNALLPLPDGDMILGSSLGLWRYRDASRTIEPWARAISPHDLDIQALVRDERGNIWIGSSTEGVFQVDPSGVPRQHHTRADGLAGNDVRALLVDRRARVWIGTYTGLSRIDGEGQNARSWGRDRLNPDGLRSDRVHALFEDRSGLVWVGTWLGGAHIYNPAAEAFREYRAVPGVPGALPGNAVRTMHIDTDNSLMLGVQEGGGLVEFDPDRGVVQRWTPIPGDPGSIGSDRVQTIARDLDGALWIGFVDSGIDRLAPGSTTFEHFRAAPDDPSRPQGDDVLELYVDRAGTLWIGYQNAGLDSRCRGCSEFRRHPLSQGAADEMAGQNIAVVFESSRGELWVGARPGGLMQLDRDSGRVTAFEALVALEDGNTPRAITCISESRNGELWVGTQGAGIFRLDLNGEGRYRVRSYTPKEGLAAAAIGSVVEDAAGLMWASTTQGISRIDPDSGAIENYSASAGTQSDGYFVDAGGVLPDGRIAFSGLQGLTMFDPGHVSPRAPLLAPVVSEVRVFESSVSDRSPHWRYRYGNSGEGGVNRDALWLHGGSGGFGLSFSALAFADPDSVQYSYRLDPIDPDWTVASARLRSVGYAHLDPGNYVLRLRARYPGNEFSPERQIDVRLDPLWWQTVWARGALLLGVIGAIVFWNWTRNQQLAERARNQAVLAESEERLKLALWGTGDEFWDADLQSGRLIRVNPLDHLRVTHEASEQSLRGFAPFLHPDDVEGFDKAFSAHLVGHTEAFDFSFRSQDRDRQWRWLRSRGRSVQRDENNRALRMAGITSDITELKEYERTLQRINQALEDRVTERTVDLTRLNNDLLQSIEQLRLTQHQLVESEKLAALGGLVAGIAHEINTPVGVGVTAASHLEQQARDFARVAEQGEVGPEQIEAFRALVQECSSIVLRNLQRADRMIRSFKLVAVDQASEHARRFELDAYMEEVLVSLQPALKRGQHRVTVDIPRDMVLHSHPGALYQIIVNLVMNSLTHGFGSRGPGNIRISASMDGAMAVIDYSDDGCGLSEEVKRRIFEPFFTTSRGQGGSGLGMHIVYNLATQLLGGTIECDAEVERGARFVLRIPITHPSVATDPDASAATDDGVDTT